MRSLSVLFALLLGAALGPLAGAPAHGADLPLNRIALPPGFVIELWARVDDARGLALGERSVFVGSRSAGHIHAVPFDAAMRAAAPLRLASDLQMPVGVAFRDGALYASAVSRILRWDGIEARLAAPGAPTVIRDDFPTETHHGWKAIAFGPDGWLYVPVGAPCNSCEPDPERYAALFRLSPDGKRRERVALGIRNTVGFDWQPGSGALWFGENGRDWLGDDSPPDELNTLAAAPRAAAHFGYPYCHGGDLPDPEFGKRRACCGERVILTYTKKQKKIEKTAVVLDFERLRGRERVLMNCA